MKIFFGLVLMATFAQAQVSTTTLLEDLVNRDLIPKLRSYTVHQFSPADITGHNRDFVEGHSNEANYPLLKMKNDDPRLAAAADIDGIEGPGAIVRIWVADSRMAGKIRIEIDGKNIWENSPSLGNFLSGKIYPFIAPLVAGKNDAGQTSYFPIPFSKSCKIFVDNPLDLFYFQVTYIKFPPGTQVQSFRNFSRISEEGRTLKTTIDKWLQPARKYDLRLLGDGPIYVPALKSTHLPTISRPGGGKINAITFKPYAVQANNVAASQKNIMVKIKFDPTKAVDPHRNYDIEAPLTDLMGSSFYNDGSNSFFTGHLAIGSDGKVDQKTAVLALPMPFAESADIEIENGNEYPIAVEARADVSSEPFNPATTGYLHAKYFQEMPSFGSPHPWLNLKKDAANPLGYQGHFVGVVQGMIQQPPAEMLASLKNNQYFHVFGFLEGDEQIRVDDEAYYKIEKYRTVLAPFNGTGNEDYFNFAYYFRESAQMRPNSEYGGIVERPLYGVDLRVEKPKVFGAIGVHRFHALDAPTFKTAFQAQIEHSNHNDSGFPGLYFASTVFWYSPQSTPLSARSLSSDFSPTPSAWEVWNFSSNAFGTRRR